MLKKFINENTIADLPKNGVIKIPVTDDFGNVTETTAGASNLNLLFDKNIELANYNGYYEYVGSEEPEYDEETQHIIQKYIIADNTISLSYNIVENDEEG